MTNTTFSVLTDMILDDAKRYADNGDTQIAIKLWRYSMSFEKKYKEIEIRMEEQIRKKIKKEFKLKTRKTPK
jgi:hypothetical protein